MSGQKIAAQEEHHIYHFFHATSFSISNNKTYKLQLKCKIIYYNL